MWSNLVGNAVPPLLPFSWYYALAPAPECSADSGGGTVLTIMGIIWITGIMLGMFASLPLPGAAEVALHAAAIALPLTSLLIGILGIRVARLRRAM